MAAGAQREGLGPDEQVVEVAVQLIVAAFRPLKVILFGSRARGTAKTTSDVDLLVVLPEVEDKRQAAVEMRRLLRDLPVSKDIVVTTPEEITRRANLPGNFLRHALAEGRVVYERPRARRRSQPLAALRARGPRGGGKAEGPGRVSPPPRLLACAAGRGEGPQGGPDPGRDGEELVDRTRICEHYSTKTG